MRNNPSKPSMLRSGFDLSHTKTMTVDMGKLIPICCIETLPNSDYKIDSEALMRMMPMVAPIMHQVQAFVKFYEVPLRIIWDEQDKFFTGGRLGQDVVNHPKFTGKGVAYKANFGKNSLGDYLGLPVLQWDHIGASNVQQAPISQLQFRAMAKIWNDHIRNPDFEEEYAIPTDSLDIELVGSSDPVIAPVVHDLTKLRKAKWEKDFYTSAKYSTQRGADVFLPLGESAPVKGNPRLFYDGDIEDPAESINFQYVQTDTNGYLELDDSPEFKKLHIMQGLEANLQEATAVELNVLREAFSLKYYLEAMLEAGGRYIDYLRKIFGQRSSNKSLQMAEYISGGRINFNIGEVLQTSETNTTPQGSMAGHGYAAGNFRPFSRHTEEHGFIIGILEIKPRTQYAQGLPKMFSRFDRFDYATPQFANIGLQPIKKKEIYLNGAGTIAANDEDWGYEYVYDDYRYMPDTVHGELRDTQKQYSMFREFDGVPALNAAFLECDPTTRIYPIIDEQQITPIVILVHNKVYASLPLPKNGNPI